MKLQDLPSPYRELAEMRRTEKSDFLSGAFSWKETAEGTGFWSKVNNGQLPEIHASSLQELAEWQKSKGEKVEPTPEPTLIGGKTEQEWLYLFAGQAMQGLLSNSEVGNQIGNHENMAAVSIEQAKALLTQLKKEVENA